MIKVIIYGVWDGLEGSRIMKNRVILGKWSRDFKFIK